MLSLMHARCTLTAQVVRAGREPCSRSATASASIQPIHPTRQARGGYRSIYFLALGSLPVSEKRKIGKGPV